MAIRVGINGFGRIGRAVMRAALESTYPDIAIVHINDLTPSGTLAHLLKYDSIHGRLAEVTVHGEAIKVGGQTVSVSSVPVPAEIPWKETKVDIVFECTGLFSERSKVNGHLEAKAPKVLISAPSKGEDLTVVYGVNSEQIKPEHRVVSNGSCTTNCLAPIAKVIHAAFTVESALMNTIHSYTNDQRILDLAHKDLRRARAAAINMIPTSTGAAKAIGLVIPELAGKIDGLAVRVPTPNVSMVDVTFTVSSSTSVEEVNRALQAAADSELKGVMSVTEEPLVSSDFLGDSASSTVDAGLTKVINGNMIKILAWYDNEAGFSHRMLDVARLMVN